MADRDDEFDNKCVGRPLGWTGGDVKFCNEPVQIGTRFCFRCHIVAIKYAAERLAGLQRQVTVATYELNTLIEESKAVQQ